MAWGQVGGRKRNHHQPPGSRTRADPGPLVFFLWTRNRRPASSEGSWHAERQSGGTSAGSQAPLPGSGTGIPAVLGPGAGPERSPRRRPPRVCSALRRPKQPAATPVADPACVSPRRGGGREGLCARRDPPGRSPLGSAVVRSPDPPSPRGHRCAKGQSTLLYPGAAEASGG